MALEGGDAGRAGEPEAPPPGGAVRSESAFVRFGLLFYGGMIAAALLWRMGFAGESILFRSPAAETAGLASPLRDAALGLAAGLAVVALSSTLTALTRFGERLARGLAEAIGPISVPNALLLATASGLGEELLFRSALQPRVGLVFASLIFGAMHFVPRREMLPWTGFAVAVGFGFGVLFDRTGNVIAPVVAHTVVNAINLPLLARRYGRAD